MHIQETTTEDARQEAIGHIMRMSESECFAVLLMIKNPEADDQLLSRHSREDFMAALEVLERVNGKLPHDAECQRAIRFIRQNFQ